MNHTPATFDLFKILGEAFDPKNAKVSKKKLRSIKSENDMFNIAQEFEKTFNINPKS